MKRLLLPVLALLVFPAAADAALLFSTTPNGNAAWGSDYGTVGGSGFRTYDNFLLNSGAYVDTVTWDFLYLDLNAPLPAPAPAPDVNQWVVAFYADNAGVPGAQLATHTFAAADVTASLVGTGTYGVGGNVYNINSYHYSIDLPAAFLAQQDTTYWLSVLALSNTYNPIAAWRGGNGGPADTTYQEQLGPGMAVVGDFERGGDRAFSLAGRQAPEPSMLLLAAMGLGAAVVRRRRNR